MKTGITGATGQLGRLVVEKLKNSTGFNDLVALVRSPEKAAGLGIETRAFDYGIPEQLADGLQGISHLLLISGNEVGQRFVQHQRVIEAARRAGVSWIIYTSLLRADTSGLSLAVEHRQTEELLKISGIPYTILRNGWYTENYNSSIAGSLQTGSLIGSAGDGRISSASREDYATAAAVVLTTKAHAGRVYELAGDSAFTLSDLAAEISEQTGKHIPYRDLPEDEYARILVSAGLPGGLASAIAGWDAGASRGDLFDDGHQLSQLIGRPTTSLAKVVKKALATLS